MAVVFLSSENATYHLTVLIFRALDKYYYCQDKYYRYLGQMDKYTISGLLRKQILRLTNFPNMTEAFRVKRIETPVQ